MRRKCSHLKMMNENEKLKIESQIKSCIFGKKISRLDGENLGKFRILKLKKRFLKKSNRKLNQKDVKSEKIDLS